MLCHHGNLAAGTLGRLPFLKKMPLLQPPQQMQQQRQRSLVWARVVEVLVEGFEGAGENFRETTEMIFCQQFTLFPSFLFQHVTDSLALSLSRARFGKKAHLLLSQFWACSNFGRQSLACCLGAHHCRDAAATCYLQRLRVHFVDLCLQMQVLRTACRVAIVIFLSCDLHS